MWIPWHYVCRFGAWRGEPKFSAACIVFRPLQAPCGNSGLPNWAVPEVGNTLIKCSPGGGGCEGWHLKSGVRKRKVVRTRDRECASEGHEFVSFTLCTGHSTKLYCEFGSPTISSAPKPHRSSPRSQKFPDSRYNYSQGPRIWPLFCHGESFYCSTPVLPLDPFTRRLRPTSPRCAPAILTSKFLHTLNHVTF